MNDDPEFTEAGIPVHRYEDRDRDFEAADPDSESISAIENHIQRFVGKPEHVFHELVSDMVHIDLHIVPPSEEQEFYTIVTSGMSDRPMTAPEGAEEYRYAEMVIALPPDWRLNTEDFKDERHYWPLRWLKWLARFPHEHETWLSYLHTIPNGDPAKPYSDNTDLCCAMIGGPFLFGDDFCELQINQEKTIYFYTLVPLYREEMDFKLKRGSDPLLDRLAKQGVTELLDINRRNVCKKRFWIF